MSGPWTRFQRQEQQEQGPWSRFQGAPQDEPVSARERRRLDAIDRAVQRSRDATPEEREESRLRRESAYIAPISTSGQRAALLPRQAREVLLGAQSAGSGLLSVPGSVVDLAEAAVNLPGMGIEAAAGAMGHDVSIPRVRSYLGTQALQSGAAGIAENLGIPFIPREQMTQGERTVHTMGEFAVAAPAAGAALVRAAPAVGGRVGSLLGDLSAYYQRAPGRAIAAEAAGGAAAGAAVENLQDAHPALQFGGALGAGILGAGAADITLGGLPALGASLSRQLTPGAEITRDPNTGMRRSAAVESGAAARLQDRAIDPETAASTIESAMQRYRQTGMVAPDTFVLSRDPGLLAESRGQRAIDSTRFMDRDMRVQQSISEGMGGLERGAPAEGFTQFALSERGRREGQIEATVTQAERRADAAQTALRDQSTNFASRRSQQELASGRLQGVVLEEVLFPMQAERARRYDAITNAPAARSVMVDTAPLARAVSAIRGQSGAMSIPNSALEAQLSAIERGLSGGPLPYAEVSKLRPQLSDARSRASVAGDVQTVRQIDTLQAAIRQIDENLAGATIRPSMDDVAQQSRMADLFNEDINLGIQEVMRLRRTPERGQSLSQFVRARGGISDDRGDLRSVLGSQQRAASLLRPSGNRVDDAALAAWEAGYFPGTERPTANEFLDALSNDVSGRPRYPQASASSQIEADEIERARAYLDRVGVDWARADDATLRDQLNRAFGERGRSRTLEDLQAETAAMQQSPNIATIENEDALRNAIRSALDFDRERVFRYFGDPQNRAGLAVREAANIGEFGPRVGPRRGQESFARQYFFGAQANPQETARDLNQILSIAPDPAAGRQAARDYLIASAARAVGPSDNINPAVLERWLDQYRGALAEFPEVAREIQGVARDIRAGRNRATGAAEDLRRVRREANLSAREIQQGWIGLAIGGQGGNSPQNAARAILSSNNPREVTRQVMSDIEKFGSPKVTEAFRNSIARHLAQETRTSAIQQAGGADPVSYNALMRQIRRSDGALEVAFEGDPSRLRDLQNIREALEDMQFVFARVNPGGSDTMQNLSERLISMAELPVRAQFGHLKGGGIMRTLRLYAQRVPGMDNSGAVTDLIAEAAFNPELAAHLLRRPPDGNTRMAERQRTAWITRARALYTGARVAGDHDEEETQ